MLLAYLPEEICNSIVEEALGIKISQTGVFYNGVYFLLASEERPEPEHLDWRNK